MGDRGVEVYGVWTAGSLKFIEKRRMHGCASAEIRNRAIGRDGNSGSGRNAVIIALVETRLKASEQATYLIHHPKALRTSASHMCNVSASAR